MERAQMTDQYLTYTDENTLESAIETIGFTSGKKFVAGNVSERSDHAGETKTCKSSTASSICMAAEGTDSCQSEVLHDASAYCKSAIYSGTCQATDYSQHCQSTKADAQCQADDAGQQCYTSVNDAQCFATEQSKQCFATEVNAHCYAVK